MAIKISTNHQFVPTWRENDKLPKAEQIVVCYNRLTVEDMFEVQRQTGLNLFAGVPVDVEKQEEFAKFWEMCKYLVAKYSTAWSNVEVDGVALNTGKDVLAGLGADALQLFMEVANCVITKSMGNEEQAKNYESQSEPVSADSASTAAPVSPPSSSETETVEIGM